MITIERTGHVSAPVEDVWVVVSDIERTPDWIADVTRAELLEGDGLARRQRMHTRWGRRDAELDQVVTEWDPPHRIAWRHEAERIEGKPAPVSSSARRLFR